MSATQSGGTDSPFAEVRAAFEKLATADKTAFIVEATVGTLSDAIEETSQRVSDWFESMEHDAPKTDSSTTDTSPDTD